MHVDHSIIMKFDQMSVLFHIHHFCVQAVTTSDAMFEGTWPGTGATVKLFHMDARQMANNIPRIPYGVLICHVV